ncbi:N-6 DNA methylase [Nocardiopsis nanhaiensis]
MDTEGVEVTSADIARLAGVKPTAVSNWRRRHDDFPRPVGGTERSPRFDLASVEHWLSARHQAPIDPEQRLWQALESVRGDLNAGDALGLVGLLLLHLHRRPGAEVPSTPEGLSGLLDAGEDDVLSALGEGVREPAVSRPRPTLTPRLVNLLLTAARTAAAHGAQATFDSLHHRLDQAMRTGSHALSPALADLMVRLSDAPGGVVADPSCGRGELLLAAARAEPRTLWGQDRDPAQLWVAILRLAFTENTPAVDIHTADALREPVFTLGAADGVVCAPPFGDRNWGSDGVADDPRWVYGVPPRLESDLAWVEHCLAQVRPGGTAVVLMPPAAARRPSGRRIRRTLLRAGALAGVVSLPAGLAAHHTVPLQLWILTRPADASAPPGPVLFVDHATSPGNASGGGSEHEVLSRIHDLWARFRHDPAGFPERPGLARAVEAADLVDEDVDLTPGVHLPVRRSPHDAAREFTERRTLLESAMERLRDHLSELTAPQDRPGPAPGSDTPPTPTGSAGSGAGPGTVTGSSSGMVTLGELAKAGSVTIRRVARRGGSEPAQTVSARVIEPEDVATGSPASRVRPVDADPMRNPPVQEGDVLVPVSLDRPIARVATEADVGAYPAPGMYVVRTNPAAVDPWFLAGFATSGDEAEHLSRVSSTRGHLRVDPSQMRLPVLPLTEQQRLGERFRRVRLFESAVREVALLGEELGAGAVDLIARQTGTETG